MKKDFLNNKIYVRLFVLVIWLAIWSLAAYFVGSDLVLPSPHGTLKALIKLLGTGTFYLNVLWTLIRTALGIVISFSLGVLLANLAYGNRALREFLRLPVSFFKSIPVMAIIIYVILVVKSNWVAVVVCFLMCFPIAYTNMLNGISSLDRKQIELGLSLGFSRKQMRRYILRPALDPYIKTALSLITAMSWKVVVAAEVLAIPKFSIGYQMLNSKYYLETADLFAYMIVLIALSLGAEKLVDIVTGLDPKRLGRALESESEAAPVLASNSSGAIRFENVTKSFVNEEGGSNKVLDGFNCEFAPGITAISAPSGSGKTTIARLIAGFESCDEGEIKVEEGTRLGYLFQEDRLLPWLNVRDNMLLALLAGNGSGLSSEDAAEQMAKKMEIEDALYMMPDELSGGMAHRVALGRTLLYGGNVLILDEPFRGLDEELRDRIIEDIGDDLRPSDFKRTVILITHDEELADSLSDRKIKI